MTNLQWKHNISKQETYMLGCWNEEMEKNAEMDGDMVK